MKILFPPILAVMLMLSACSATNNYQAFVDWANGYFKKWSNAKSSVTYHVLFNSVFESLDADKDNKLTMVEFNSQIRLFYFGIFSERLITGT